MGKERRLRRWKSKKGDGRAKRFMEQPVSIQLMVEAEDDSLIQLGNCVVDILIY